LLKVRKVRGLYEVCQTSEKFLVGRGLRVGEDREAGEVRRCVGGKRCVSLAKRDPEGRGRIENVR